MSSRVEASPTPQKQFTPGAYPSSDEDSPSPPTVISNQISLSQSVFGRRAEYTRSCTTRVKIGSWNVAALSGTEKDVGGWFVDGKGVYEDLSGLRIGAGNSGTVNAGDIEDPGSQEARRTKKASTLPKNDVGSVPGGDDIGLYVLGLQEVVDITSAAEALRPYSDPHPARKWKRAVEEALPIGYSLVAEQQLIGLYLIIYASSSLAPVISSVCTTSVGTGLMGYMGNKGGVAARIVLGETTRMVFVNCHLTAGTEKGSLERRNWDSSQILNRAKFDPVYNGSGVMEEFSEGIGDEDFGFWFGDLNYRLDSMPGDDVRRLLILHTQNLYKTGQASEKKIDSELSDQGSSVSLRSGKSVACPPEDDRSSSHTVVNTINQSIPPSILLSDSEPIDPATDPASLHTTLSSLLPHDQLHVQMRTGRAFHEGWREGPIEFLPTYKYDVGSVGVFDSSEKRRGPSWCDRILYRTRKDKLEYLRRAKEEQENKRRDEELRKSGIADSAVEDESVLFEYDPDTDGAHEEYDPDERGSKSSEVVITQPGIEDRLHLDYYTSHQRVISSDHKPLDAVFTLRYDAIDPELKMKVHQEVARELDKAENEGRPVVTVVVDHNIESKTDSQRFEGVNFGDIRYACAKVRNFTVANTGRVPATVGFVDRTIEQGRSGGVAPSWLTIQFDRQSDNDNANPNALREYTLEPGDAANVELTVHVTEMSQVRRLNDGFESLEDVLVLRIQNGRDYFLPLRGKWLKSAFGRSLKELVHIPEGGVRRLQHQRLDSGNHEDQGVNWSAPRELFRLTESIEELVERSIAEWGMKDEQGRPPWDEITGWPFAPRVRKEEERKEKEQLKQTVREGLDKDLNFTLLFPAGSASIDRLEAAAETLVEFAASLEDGIITAGMWAAIEKGMLERERARKNLAAEEERTWVLEILSSVPTHSISFTFIVFMLSRVANEIAPMKPVEPETVLRTSKDTSRGEESELWPRVQRKEVEGAFAAIFAEAMIRTAPMTATIREKERKASEGRRKAVVELFLR